MTTTRDRSLGSNRTNADKFGQSPRKLKNLNKGTIIEIGLSRHSFYFPGWCLLSLRGRPRPLPHRTLLETQSILGPTVTRNSGAYDPTVRGWRIVFTFGCAIREVQSSGLRVSMVGVCFLPCFGAGRGAKHPECARAQFHMLCIGVAGRWLQGSP